MNKFLNLFHKNRDGCPDDEARRLAGMLSKFVFHYIYEFDDANFAAQVEDWAEHLSKAPAVEGARFSFASKSSSQTLRFQSGGVMTGELFKVGMMVECVDGEFQGQKYDMNVVFTRLRKGWKVRSLDIKLI